MVAEPVFIEISAIQGAEFHSILPDLGHLGDVRPIRDLVDYQVPCPLNMVNLLLRRMQWSQQAVQPRPRGLGLGLAPP